MLHHIKCPRCLQVSWMCRWYRELRYPPKTNMTGWNIHHLKMYFLLNIGILQCHVSFQFMVGTIFVGTFKGISRDPAEFFTGMVQKNLHVNPSQNGDFEFIWSQQKEWSLYEGKFPNTHFAGICLELHQIPPKSSMRKTLGRSKTWTYPPFFNDLFAPKQRRIVGWNTAWYRVNNLYYLLHMLIPGLILSFVAQIIIAHHGNHCYRTSMMERDGFSSNFLLLNWGYLGL